MMKKNGCSILPVILAGGSGTRLWPISTHVYPKQFLSLFDSLSFFQKTVKRAAALSNVLNPLIICGEQHCSLVQSQLNQISVNPLSIITEPIGRNTAPAVAIAAIQQIENSNDPILLVLPSDHIITDLKVFQDAILKAVDYAQKDKLVTFGIVPNQPDVNYGYIKAGEVLDKEKFFFQVEKFVEKPDWNTAEQYVQSRKYHWNSGMFMFRASVFLKELSRFEPEITDCCELMKTALLFNASKSVYQIPLPTFQLCPKKSIDYAVMEKTRNAVVMPCDIGWSDIGTWHALWQHHLRDSNENAVWGNVELDEVERCLIYVQGKSLSLRQKKDCVIVHANNEIFETDLPL